MLVELAEQSELYKQLCITLNKDDIMELMIIGGGAGGPAAASRTRRLDEEAVIGMFERGQHISYGHCGLPYYIGGAIQDREDLLISTPEKFKDLYNVDVHVRSEVKKILTEAKQIEIEDLTTGETYTQEYDNLILASGSSPIRPPLSGIDLEGIFTLRNLTNADDISQFISQKKPTSAVVVGGGFIGLEMAENLNHQNIDVTIVEMLDQVMPPLDKEMADPLHHTLMLHGVELALSDPVAEFERQDEQIVVKLKSGREIKCGMVILSIGVKPNLELAKSAGLDIGEAGGIKVDEHMQSSDPHIYAVGDAVETTHLVTGKPAVIPLAGPASRQARIAVDNIYGRDVKYKGTLGTSLVKVFETTVGTVGVNEKTLKKLGMEYQKCYIQPFSHVTYYPDAAPMSVKLLFHPDSGRILGSQIVGSEGVDKRIDSLATAISAGMTVEDLSHLEMGYVPQYGSAKEVLNVAGYVASNILNGDMPVAHWDQMDKLLDGDGVFLDIRDEDVIGMGVVPGAINIPLHQLRHRLDELPKDVPIYVYCNVGVESYIAIRTLVQHGFDARNMSGGYGIYKSTCLGTDTTKQVNRMSNEPDIQTLDVQQVANEPEHVEYLDACGLQCPGPILKVKQKLDELQPGNVLEVAANDTGFAMDLPAWCRSVGHEVLSIEAKDGRIVGQIRKCDQEAEGAALATQPNLPKEKTIVVFSNDFDKAISSFIIANGAAAMGHQVNLFFTFWGLNILRKSHKVKVRKPFIEKMFGWMMPRGNSTLKLSKMNMGGMGTRMMKGVMKKKNVNSLKELMEMARQQGVRMIACTMTMNIMGLQREELIDGIDEGGVAAFLEHADQSNMTLFI